MIVTFLEPFSYCSPLSTFTFTLNFDIFDLKLALNFTVVCKRQRVTFVRSLGEMAAV